MREFQGARGPRGVRGATGARGMQGAQGIQGASETDGLREGLMGPLGPTGPQGMQGERAAGSGAIIPFSYTESTFWSYSGVTDSATTGVIIGLSSGFQGITETNGVIELINAPLFAISMSNLSVFMPRDGIITGISACFMSLEDNILPANLNINYSLYRGIAQRTNIFEKIPGTTVTITIDASTIKQNEPFYTDVTALNIPIPSGTRLLLATFVDKNFFIISGESIVSGYASGAVVIE